MLIGSHITRRPRLEITVAKCDGSQSLVGVKDDGSTDILPIEFINNSSLDIVSGLFFFKNYMVRGLLGKDFTRSLEVSAVSTWP